ncbi:MAG: protein GrpE [Gemmatales bacterium]|nr:MAG: protein GrpE [Gemmatales bacterium]
MSEPADNKPTSEQEQAQAESAAEEEGQKAGQEVEPAAEAPKEETIEEVRRQRDEYLELLQRTKADFENYQKRNQREREQERKYVLAPLARDLLPVVDNLERALAAAEQSGDVQSLIEGVRIMKTQILDIFRRHGITRMEAEGQPFDPHLHQALMRQPTDDEESINKVAQVLEAGYFIHDRVLRPASVAVAVRRETSDEKQSTQSP